MAKFSSCQRTLASSALRRWAPAFAGATILLFGAPAIATSPSVPLELPHRIVLQDSPEPARVASAIRAALTLRKWAIESDSGSEVTARLDVRGHTLRVRLAYDENEIRFAYVDSVEMGYAIDKGVALIHPTGNKWLYRLANEVREQVQRVVYEGESADVVPAADDEPD